MSFSETLSSNDIQLILNKLNINWRSKQPDKEGWVTIKSPLREDKNPSFGLNIETGCFTDHARDDIGGDIVTLVEYHNNATNEESIQWIKHQLNYDSHRLGNRKTNGRKESHSFWTAKRVLKLSEAQERLENETGHFVLRSAKDYDQLTQQTLKHFGCGILDQYGKDWLAFPYETSCQLYRRGNDGKVIRNLKGSAPGKSFFGTRQINEKREALIISKSPRETMLMNQMYRADANAVGLATGEQASMSARQRRWLKREISEGDYAKIFIFLDCDTDTAYKAARDLARNVNEIAIGQEVSIINIHQISEGKHKDITDLVRHESGNKLFNNLYNNREIIGAKNNKSPKGTVLNITPDDLRLPSELVKILPPVVKKYLDYASPLSDVPNEFLLTPFLTLAGTVIGKSRFVKLGGHEFFPTIWTVLFAGSSTLRKSTALSLAQKPFIPIMNKFEETYEKERIRWEQEQEWAEENDELFDEPPPIKNTLYAPDGFSDVTFWETLRDNGSIASVPSEFTALWKELNRPRNALGDIALDIFDAKNSIRRTTKSAGDIELTNPIWCVTGATTLTNFRQALTSNERSSGLLQRILPVCMEERTKDYKALTELESPNMTLYRQITQATMALHQLSTKSVRLSHQARQHYTTWSHKTHKRAQKLTDRLPDIGGYNSRLSVYGLKFALILQQLDQPDSKISGKNMKAAIALCEWLFNHIIYMLERNYIFDKSYADRLKIRELIEKQSSRWVIRTDLMNRSNFAKDRLDKALDSDIEAGIIEEKEIKTEGRPRHEYRLTQPT